MTQINLLPWRENARRLRKTQLTIELIISVVIACFILLIMHLRVSSVYYAQQAINNVLVTAISDETASTAQLTAQAAENESTIQRLLFIMNKYKTTYQAIDILNELVTTVPDTITLLEMKRIKSEIMFTGLAKTEDEVTEFINIINKSSFFSNPVLEVINIITNPVSKTLENRFQLTFAAKGP